MEIRIRPTAHMVLVHGSPARVWAGTTPQGRSVMMATRYICTGSAETDEELARGFAGAPVLPGGQAAVARLFAGVELPENPGSMN